jgi:hypothetical protein
MIKLASLFKSGINSRVENRERELVKNRRWRRVENIPPEKKIQLCFDVKRRCEESVHIDLI